MIITSSQVNLSATTQRRESTQETEQLALYRVNAEGETEQISEQRALGVALREQAVSRVASLHSGRSASVAADPVKPGSDTTAPPLEPRYQLMAAIVGALTGREIRIFNAATLQSQSAELETTVSIASQSPDGAVDGMRYEWTRETVLTEEANVDARALIHTADGRELNLELRLDMAVSRSARESLVIRAGVQMKDPLVINLGDSAAALTDQIRSFDIDADGAIDQIYALNSRSGFLALDKNGDGQINDGTELFGALSGDGFKDLVEFDTDSNGFIDEGDTLFGQLQIWIQSEQGEDRLVSLADQGIGAIYLGSVATPLTLYVAGDELGGRIRSTGFFIREDGSASTVQQIDLKA